MATPPRETRADRLIRWFKDHPVFALLLVLMMGLTVVFKFFGEGAAAFAKVWDAREKMRPAEPPAAPSPSDTVYLPQELPPQSPDPAPPATRPVVRDSKTAAPTADRTVDCLILFPAELAGATCGVFPQPPDLVVNMTRARASLSPGVKYKIELRGRDGGRRVATVRGGTSTVTARQFSADE